ncbi:MAG: M20 family metallo-hydrolase, partial [Deltaproteobacteria bacterium]|nr:M20 family metallo-hydrolase [Deltaproteobacteria bacterium]
DMGNLFARREGLEPGAAPVLCGSHLDTQPTGGRYDGVYGVLAGLEVLRSLNEAGVTTLHPLEVVVWTNEEGSRFQPAMMGSGVFAGVLDKGTVHDTRDAQGQRVLDALERIGYRGTLPCQARPIQAYLEAHIEQGPILEAEGRTIGIVTGIQGIKWYKATLTGVNAHAGTTPMEVRRDPLVGAARMIAEIDRITRAFRPDAMATVGEFTVDPGSINVINQRVRFSLDLRCPEASGLAELERRVLAATSDIAASNGLNWTLEPIWHSPPTVFAPEVVGAVEQAAREQGLSARPIVSGAGHDAKYLSEICPTAMVFIPCAGGISHNESESITSTDAEAGANVLLSALVRLAKVP